MVQQARRRNAKLMDRFCHLDPTTPHTAVKRQALELLPQEIKSPKRSWGEGRENSSLALWPSQQGRWHLSSPCPEFPPGPSGPLILTTEASHRHQGVGRNSWDFSTLETLGGFEFLLSQLYLRNLRRKLLGWPVAELVVSKIRNACKMTLVRHRFTKL